MPKDVSVKTGSAPSKYTWLAVFGLVFVAIACLAYAQKPPDACGQYRDDKKITINGQTLAGEVAVTQSQLTMGLGGRACIGADQAMLFVFNRPGQYAFWMKGMRFPIDMVWIGGDDKIVDIQPDVSPSTYPRQFVNSHGPAQYVLELRAGRAQTLGAALGTPVSF